MLNKLYLALTTLTLTVVFMPSSSVLCMNRRQHGQENTISPLFMGLYLIMHNQVPKFTQFIRETPLSEDDKDALFYYAINKNKPVFAQLLMSRHEVTITPNTIQRVQENDYSSILNNSI